MIEHPIINFGSFHVAALKMDPGDETVETLGSNPVGFVLLHGSVDINGQAGRLWRTMTFSGDVRIKAHEKSLVARVNVNPEDARRLG